MSLQVSLLAALLMERADLVAENLALRHQLGCLQRQRRRPRLTIGDRLFWVVLLRVWSGWRDALVIVQPATVIAWHRRGFGRFWQRRSKRHAGRPAIAPELRALIRQMATLNVGWGAPRIHGELQKLGIKVSQATVSFPPCASGASTCSSCSVWNDAKSSTSTCAPTPTTTTPTAPTLAWPKTLQTPAPSPHRSSVPVIASARLGGLHHRYRRRDEPVDREAASWVDWGLEEGQHARRLRRSACFRFAARCCSFPA